MPINADKLELMRKTFLTFYSLVYDYLINIAYYDNNYQNLRRFDYSLLEVQEL